MQRGAQLVEGSVSSNLANLTGPMLIGITSIMIMNFIDTFFVARLGAIPLAALSYTFPVVATLGSVAMGMGIGATSVLARAIGEGHDDRVRRVTTDTLMLSLIVVGVLSTVGYLTITPVFSLLGADAQTLPLVDDYMSVWYLGMIFLVIPMVGNSALRATGDAATPARIMVGAALFNIILDPIFIFWLDLGVRGAAIATVIARAMTLVLSLYFLIFREEMVTFQRPSLRQLVQSWRDVLRIGAPAAATNAVSPMTLGILTGLVSTYGHEAVAAYGAGSRAAMLALVPVMALGASMGPFVGQNWGARRRDRIGEAINLADRAALVWGVVVWVLLVIFREPVAGLFTTDEEVASTLAMFLVIAPAGMGLQGVVGIAGASFNAINQPLRAAGLTILRTPTLSVPLALLGSATVGVEGIFLGMAVSEVLTGLVARQWTRGLRLGSAGAV
ncbi:MAG: putative MATE family efflux protein [Myxococcota bacterium]|jgi:putative MATE family efflux protein